MHVWAPMHVSSRHLCALAKGRSLLLTHERPLPSVKSLFSIFHYVFRRHQGIMRRYNALVLAPRLDDSSSMRHEGAALAPCAHRGRILRQIKEASTGTG